MARSSGAAGGALLRSLLVVAVLCAGPLTGQERPPEVTDERIEVGREIFTDSGMCWACHGADAKGARGVGPDLTDDDWWHSDGSYEAIVRQITTGVPADQIRNKLGAVMPPRGGSSISDEQVRAVAAYVWSLRESTQPGAA